VSRGLYDKCSMSWIACPCFLTALSVIGVVHCNGREPEDAPKDVVGRGSGSSSSSSSRLAFSRALST
jgi:hypothetical protein